MRALLQHIVVFLALMTVSASCSRKQGEVIPRGKMAMIYAEMLMSDQWINARPEIRRTADTSLVYEPILMKYGYDHKDYLKTVDVYMDDPERFARIFRESGDIIEERLIELRKELDRLNKLEALKKRIERMTIKSDFKPEEFFPYFFDEPYVHYYDSLVVEVDSVIQHYRFRDVPTTDTLYEGVRMLLQTDSLTVADSLTVTDSLEVADSIAKLAAPEKMKGSVKMSEPVKVKGNMGRVMKEPLKRQAAKVTDDEILFD